MARKKRAEKGVNICLKINVCQHELLHSIALQKSLDKGMRYSVQDLIRDLIGKNYGLYYSPKEV